MPGTDVCLTMTVPEAGKRYLGLSRNGSYRAAAAGIIPAIRVGKLLRVPVAAMDRLVGVSTAANGPDEKSAAVAEPELTRSA
jgi:excisionase family DNA binding protein